MCLSDTENGLARPEQRCTALEVADYVREAATEPRLVHVDELSKPPFLLDSGQVSELISDLVSRNDCADIRILRSDLIGQVLYCGDLISDNYAKMMLLIMEKDPLRLIAQSVRDESAVYPRPTDLRLFSVPPFSLSEADVEAHVTAILGKEEYSDIEVIIASTGRKFLFSSKYLDKDWAVSLVEWFEVGQFENP